MPSVLFSITSLLLITSVSATLWDTPSTLGSSDNDNSGGLVQRLSSAANTFAEDHGLDIPNTARSISEAAEWLTELRLRATSRSRCELISPPLNEQPDEEHDEAPCPTQRPSGRHISRLPRSAQKSLDTSDGDILQVLKEICACGCADTVRQHGPNLVLRCREQRWDGGVELLARLLEQAVETLENPTPEENVKRYGHLKLAGKVTVETGLKVCVPMFFKLFGVRHNMQVQLRKKALSPTQFLQSLWNTDVVVQQRDAIIKRSLRMPCPCLVV